MKIRIGIPVFCILVAGFVYFVLPNILSTKYDSHPLQGAVASETASSPAEKPIAETPAVPIVEPVTHIKTPDAVKGLYISSWGISSTKLMDKINPMLDTTEANTVIIDIKDATGKVSFLSPDKALIDYGSSEKRIPNLRRIINDFHARGVYVIGRIAVFQDPFMTKKNPDWAIKKKSDGTVWKDNKGLSFLDPSNKEVWKYIETIAKDSYAEGFDEINFDYIRFPSDGKISDIAYPKGDGTVTRADIIKSFFVYLNQELKDTGMVRSADLFGLVTTATDDLGIGQTLENALPYFDYVAPMVYPSHYADGTYNIAKPAQHPYEIVKASMTKAVERAKAIGEDPLKLRPWLQHFNLGATYTPAMVRDQIKATYDSGLTSWMLWNASNVYSSTALEKE